MKQASVIELAPFTLGRNQKMETLFANSERLERELLCRSPGYLGRILAQKSETEWCDIVFWRSLADAEAIKAAAAASEACMAYFACMAGEAHDDMDSGVTRYRKMRAYGKFGV